MEKERVNKATEEPMKKKTRLVARKHTGFQCSFCGSYTTSINEYYSSLTDILLTRYINLLKSDRGQSYFDGVIDCIHAVFGSHNPVMRRALKLEGYLDAFEQRHGKMEEDMGYKLKCSHCNEWKWEHLITIDDSKVAKFICEDCLPKKQEN